MEQNISDEKPILCVKSEAKTFIWTTIFLIFVIPGSLLISGVSISYLFLFVPLMLLVLYLVKQKTFKQFELYKDKFIVKYPWSFLYQTKVYNYSAIKSIKIRSPKGRGESMLFSIKWEEHNKIRKRNHWFAMDHDKIQRLIDELRNLNLEVEVDDIGMDLH